VPVAAAHPAEFSSHLRPTMAPLRSTAMRCKRRLRESVHVLSPVMPLSTDFALNLSDQRLANRLWPPMELHKRSRSLYQSSRNRQQDKEGCSVWWHAVSP
jgi:hypothetical protein